MEDLTTFGFFLDNFPQHSGSPVLLTTWRGYISGQADELQHLQSQEFQEKSRTVGPANNN